MNDVSVSPEYKDFDTLATMCVSQNNMDDLAGDAANGNVLK
jgi:hypothetical protein